MVPELDADPRDVRLGCLLIIILGLVSAAVWAAIIWWIWTF